MPRPYPRTRSQDVHLVGDSKLVSESVVKIGATLFEELNHADHGSGGASSASVAVPGVGAEKSRTQRLEAMFLESRDITEVDISSDEVPTELKLVDVVTEDFQASPRRGGPKTVAAVPLVSGWPGPTYVPSSRLATWSSQSAACKPPPRSCTDCHHAHAPLTVRQTRFECLQAMCGPAPALPELLSTPEPLSQRCDWKIPGGTVGDWRKCPQRPLPAYERTFDGSKYWLLETRRRELERLLRERAAKAHGVPVHLYVPKKPFFEWPPPPGFN